MRTSRLRKFRKSAHLTQREVAALVGYTSQRGYSDMELGTKLPAVVTALACCILFDISLSELFPGLSESVEREVEARTRKLCARLAADGDREAAAAFLEEVIERLGRSA